jgi:hypothetical protein
MNRANSDGAWWDYTWNPIVGLPFEGFCIQWSNVEITGDALAARPVG